MTGDSHRWGERFLGFAFLVLLGALALYGAARLVLAAWLVLVVTGGVLLALAVLVGWWRARQRGW